MPTHAEPPTFCGGGLMPGSLTGGTVIVPVTVLNVPYITFEESPCGEVEKSLTLGPENMAPAQLLLMEPFWFSLSRTVTLLRLKLLGTLRRGPPSDLRFKNGSISWRASWGAGEAKDDPNRIAIVRNDQENIEKDKLKRESGTVEYLDVDVIYPCSRRPAARRVHIYM